MVEYENQLLNKLKFLYLEQKMSVTKIAKYLGISYGKVYYRLKQSDIFLRKGTDYPNSFLGKKHSQKTKLKISKANKARKRTPHSEETKRKIGNAHRDKKLSKKTKEKISQNHANVSGKNNPMSGRMHSNKTREKISKAIKGKIPIGNMHHWYKGPGKRRTELVKLIRTCGKYKQWRTAIFKRDAYACIFCGKNSKNNSSCFLNADHIKPFALVIRENKIKTLEQAKTCEELWSLSNGRTLCVECHKETDSFAKRLQPIAN
jgi:hypothetical protein